MTEHSEVPQVETYPQWIPVEVKVLLPEVTKKEAVSLEYIKRKSDQIFVNPDEVSDVKNILAQVKNPIFVGINGSRALNSRPPLFPTVEEFDQYLGRQAKASGYLSQEEYIKDLPNYTSYSTARSLLADGNFNERYKRGERFPTGIVRFLVSDIDLLIISQDDTLKRGTVNGDKTNVSIDLNIVSPGDPFDRDPLDLQNYIANGLSSVRPLAM